MSQLCTHINMKLVVFTVLVIVTIAVFKHGRSGQYNLTVIHFNDFHARYEPIDNQSTTCEGSNCIGGFFRLYSTIKLLQQNNPNSLLLNAGDNFQGTLWYIVHKWNVTQHFLNKLSFDALTLGNHEFDDGIAGLVPFLNHIKAPVVVSNIDDSKEPRLQNLYRKSVVVEKGGKKIGIIGVLLTETNLTSHTENLIFRNEIESVNAEAKKLENEVFTNIVLSHGGYKADLEMARKSVGKISMVVGGHTDTFLYTGSPVPGPDKPSGPYPTVVTNQKGNQVLVVQASAYTKYLGNLTVFFDDSGNVVDWNGAPIFLGPKIPTDEDIDADLSVWKKAVDLEGSKIVGSSMFTMPKQPCREEECPLGNFATDAMVSSYKFADLTHEEIYSSAKSTRREVTTVRSSPPPKFIPRDDVPESIDWRDYGVVTPISNQELCMSCWAFAVVSTLEAHVGIYQGRNVSLSQQNLVDCVDPTFTCSQYLDIHALDNTYQYIVDNGGIDLRDSYPVEYYTVGSCRFKSETVGATIKAYGNITEGDEEELKAVVGTIGPVTVTITTDFSWDLYREGVYYNEDCMNTDEIFNHAVVVIGYGSEDGEDYWLVKNSWGTYFGQDGYIKMARNRDNNCGIASIARYPLI